MLLAGAAMLGVMSSAAYAQSKQHFRIPASDAGDAVQSVAQQSGLQVLAPDADLRGVRTNPIDGDYSPIDALHRMLAGHGLEVVAGQDGIVTIRRATVVGQAETKPDPLAEDIVVTGSRIRRPGFDTLEATIVTDSEVIAQRGYTNVAQVFDDTPGFVASGVNPIGTTQGTFNAGQSFVDFLGLGSQRTLALINGRRAVSSNSISGSGNNASPGQQVDLNVIPVGLIERVETIAIGGAPIYGSDAIAGTVNIILKDKYQGLSVTGQYGISERGDAPGYSIRGLAGINFDEGRGNIAISGEYHEQKGMVLSKRSGLRFAVPKPGSTPSNTVTNDLVYGYFTEGGLPFDPNTFGFIRDSSGQALQFQGGDLRAYVPGTNVRGALFDGGDGVRMADHFSLLSPTKRAIVSGIGHYDLTPSIRFVFEGSYARSEGKELSEVAAFTSPYVSGTILTVSANNPFLSPATRSTLAANGITGDFVLARNFSDLLDRGGLTVNTVNFYRAVAGLEGKTSLFGEAAGWELSVNYGKSRATTEMSYINNDRFLAAVDAVRDGSGRIVCASGGSCVPFNVFGVNAFSDEAANYVLDRGKAVSLNQQFVATANFNGALPFRISPEPIKFNIGAEYRKEMGDFRVDRVLGAGANLLGLDLASPYSPDKGSFNTKELYGELSVPLVSESQDIPIIKNLSADGSVRYVDNSIAGGDVTWAAGGRFAPRLPGIFDGLLLRGTYARAIRAPAVTELFSGASPTRGSISDPCSPANYQRGDNPAARTANCTAALSALGISSPANFNPTTAGLSPIGTISGNPNLDNEKARSWSVGVVYQPRLIPGFRVSADWTQINLTGGIESLGIQQVLAACYDSSDFPNAAGCGQFRRLTAAEVGPGTANPTRSVGDIANGYRSGYINTAGLKFAGLIVAAEYGFGMAALEKQGRIKLGAKLFHNSKFESRITDSAPVSNSVGGVGLPKWSGQFNLGYQGAALDLLLQGLYTGPVKNDILATSATIADKDNFIGSYWRFNSTLGVRVNDRFSLQLVVNNLFDRKPSQSQLFSRSFGTYDLIGRRFLFSVTAGL
ncbi:TonB-dependent receptor [Sphingomonas sp. ERG5]|uniref:TonB-dependent receptor n=1 Tax=Sphingomonas sp. ERG5 TaxID=1381597 RepID=UPI00068ED279|nr:TonB-dependent receptor [Sphingomonas sp. ERG5]